MAFDSGKGCRAPYSYASPPGNLQRRHSRRSPSIASPGPIRRTSSPGTCTTHKRRDPELLEGRSASGDFDKGATLLQKQLERTNGGTPAEKCDRDVREIAKTSLFKRGSENRPPVEDCDADGVCNTLADVEVLRRKMEGLSRGKLLKMEEGYGLILFRKQSSALQLPLQIFDLLREQLWYKPNTSIYIKLMVMLGKCKQPEKAQQVFQTMIDEGCEVNHEVYTALLSTYNVVIDAFGRAGDLRQMEFLFRLMQSERIKPNCVTFCSLVQKTENRWKILIDFESFRL